MFHYFIGSRGVEPKLKFKVQPIEEISADDLSLTKITERILLGPSISSELAPVSLDTTLSTGTEKEWPS